MSAHVECQHMEKAATHRVGGNERTAGLEVSSQRRSGSPHSGGAIEAYEQAAR